MLPRDYLLIGDELVEDRDHTAKFGLQNGPDGLALECDNGMREVVGWGDLVYEEYYEGTPAIKGRDGEVLSRLYINNSYASTGNNSADFEYVRREPKTAQQGDGATVQITLTMGNMPPIIHSVDCPSDYLGNIPQVLPPLLGNRSFSCSLNVTDPNGDEDIVSSFATLYYQHTPIRHVQGTPQDISMLLTPLDAPGLYTIHITATDQGNLTSEVFIIEFEYLASIGVGVSPVILAWDGLQLHTPGIEQEITLRSLGNAPAQISMENAINHTHFTVDWDGISFELQNQLERSILPGSTHVLSLAPIVHQMPLSGVLAGHIAISVR